MTEVKGNATIASREISVSSFVRLHILTAGEVEIYRSDTEKVVVETDENLLDYFEVENSGRTLYIGSESKFNRPVFTICRISVFLRNIDTLYVSNENSSVSFNEVIKSDFPVNIRIQEAKQVSIAIDAPHINIQNQANASILLTGKCKSINIKNQGEGDFDSGNLQADDLYIKNMGSGKIKLYAGKTIEIIQLGEGPVHYSGNAVLRDIKKSGVGEVKHI